MNTQPILDHSSSALDRSVTYARRLKSLRNILENHKDVELVAKVLFLGHLVDVKFTDNMGISVQIEVAIDNALSEVHGWEVGDAFMFRNSDPDLYLNNVVEQWEKQAAKLNQEG